MWIQLPVGMYSAVLNADDDTGYTLQVRSRARTDAEYLAKWIKDEHGVDAEVLSWPGRDYPYRVIIDIELWGSFLVAASDAIVYTNFKNEVAKHNPKRAKVYSKVWSAFLDIEDENPTGSNRSIYGGRDAYVLPRRGSVFSSRPSYTTLDDLLDREEEENGRSIMDLTEDEWRALQEEDGRPPFYYNDELPQTLPRKAKKSKGKGKRRR